MYDLYAMSMLKGRYGHYHWGEGCKIWSSNYDVRVVEYPSWRVRSTSRGLADIKMATGIEVNLLYVFTFKVLSS